MVKSSYNGSTFFVLTLVLSDCHSFQCEEISFKKETSELMHATQNICN